MVPGKIGLYQSTAQLVIFKYLIVSYFGKSNCILPSTDKIVLYGQSIGTVPTIDLASRYEVRAVILHSPLASGLRVACPDTKKTWCFDVFPSIEKICEYLLSFYLHSNFLSKQIYVNSSTKMLKLFN